MMQPFGLVCVFMVAQLNTATAAHIHKRELSSSILHYETLSYDTSHLITEHSRIRRDVRTDDSKDRHQDSIRWSFQAHNRDFTLQMYPDVHIFSKDFMVETDKGIIDFDKSRAYTGHLIGKPGSRVSGIMLRDGRFEGKILHGDEDFFIERAENYFNQEYISKEDFHSVIYKMSDIDLAIIRNTTDCKSDELRNPMRDVALNIQIPPDHQDDIDTEADGPFFSRYRQHGMYNPMRHRVKRAIDPLKTMCELYIQADHLYYEKWGSNVDTVIEQLIAHVEAVNDIYKITDFDSDSTADDIRFVIKRLKIWTDSSASGYPFSGNMDVRTFLETFSTSDNFDSFCLAYTFTHRDFNDGTLGLAWTASLDASGGVCTKNGVYNGQTMSLNTGIVTTLNFQRDVAFAVSQLTLAHELGHNLGSPHDDESDSDCAPGAEAGGNFIMFPKATDGDKQNNNQFSPCSISNMNDIMNDKARHDGDAACFKEYSSTVCGNKIVEAGEDCDCGWEDECSETCCNPQKDSYDANTYTPCTFTAGSACSPSESVCCTGSCSPRLSAANYPCRSNTSCSDTAYCDGTSTCPASATLPDGSDCESDRVCLAGECTNAICQAFGLTSCQCEPDNADDWSDPKLCMLCCSEAGECKPASEIPAITKTTTSGQGQPCQQYNGYCDVFQKCRELDPVGTINALRKALFSEEGLATVTEWMKANWYIVGAGGLGFIILMALVLRFGAKHDPIVPPESKSKAPQKNQVEPHKVRKGW